MIPRQLGEPNDHDTLLLHGRINCHRAWMIPTVPEVNDVLSPMAADTVLQILHGEGRYYGFGVHRQLWNTKSGQWGRGGMRR